MANRLGRELRSRFIARSGVFDFAATMPEYDVKADSELVDKLVERILIVVRPARIVLFGSAGRGEMRADSDFDVLVVVPDGTDCKATVRAIYRNLIGFERDADVIVATESDVDHLRDNRSLVYYPALREGKEIYAA